MAISSNSVISHPQDAPDQLLAQKQRCGQTPYLHDHEQTVARALQAACTPDSFLFDRQRRGYIAASSMAAALAVIN